MEAAKQTISNFVSGDGKHKTTVDEDVRASVTDEHVKPHRHENLMTALDKEVHQHHHHTVVQPVKHQETLPEKHVHNTIPVEHKVFQHGNDDELRDTLDRDAAKYKHTSVTHDTTHSSTTAPVVAGERVHHHVHEHVQPIVQKETIQPEVVHTTIPIHETHHAKAVHHGTSTLPTKTLDEWKSEGGVLGGRATHTLSDIAGCPAPYNKDLQTEQMGADRDMHLGHKHGMTTGAAAGGLGATEGMGSTGRHMENMPTESSRMTGTSARGDNPRGDNLRGEGLTGTRGEGLTGTRGEGLGATRGENITSTTSRGTDSSSDRLRKASSDKNAHYGLGSGTGVGAATTSPSSAPRTGAGSGSNVEQREKRHASLADKLNPFKDADGDGKKGIMD